MFSRFLLVGSLLQKINAVVWMGQMETITESLKLNLGSRDRWIPGFKNVDIDQHPSVDIVGDVSNLKDIADGSVDEIYASHILEHFEYHKTVDVLKEWHRLLRPSGKLYVAVPDFARAIEVYAHTGLDNWIIRLLCGDQEYKTAYHYALFDEERLTHQLKKAGFSDSFRVESFPLENDGDCSNLTSTLDGQSVSLNIIATK